MLANVAVADCLTEKQFPFKLHALTVWDSDHEIANFIMFMFFVGCLYALFSYILVLRKCSKLGLSVKSLKLVLLVTESIGVRFRRLN